MLSLLLRKSTYPVVAIPTLAPPYTLLTLIRLPAWNGTVEDSTISVVLGLLESINVDPKVSTSYPLTYAFPGPTFILAISFDGTLLSSVDSSGKNTPNCECLSFRLSFDSKANGVTK